MNKFTHNRWSRASKGTEVSESRSRRLQFGIKPAPESHTTKCYVPGYIQKLTQRSRESAKAQKPKEEGAKPATAAIPALTDTDMQLTYVNEAATSARLNEQVVILRIQIAALQKKLMEAQGEKEILLLILEMTGEQLATAHSTLKAKYKLIDELMKTPSEDLITIRQWTDKYEQAQEIIDVLKGECVRLSNSITKIAKIIVANHSFGKRGIAIKKTAKALLDSEPRYVRAPGNELFPINDFLGRIGEFADLPKIAKKEW